MESIEKLRTVARNMAKGRNLENHEECNLLLIIANEIEREIAEKYIELPVDADGVPIHMGDVLDPPKGSEDYGRLMVVELSYDGEDWYFKGEVVGSFMGLAGTFNVLGFTHAKPRTLESVLADLANEVWEASCTCQTTWSDSGLDGIEKKYAAEIRELMEAEE